MPLVVNRALLLVCLPFLVVLFYDVSRSIDESRVINGDIVVLHENTPPPPYYLNLKRRRRRRRRRLAQEDRDRDRPVIYTFFELKRLDKNGERDTAGEHYHQDLLDTWTQLWSDAGWEPRILSLADA